MKQSINKILKNISRPPQPANEEEAEGPTKSRQTPAQPPRPQTPPKAPKRPAPTPAQAQKLPYNHQSYMNIK